jgi:curved DNA-binding protein CbpA
MHFRMTLSEAYATLGLRADATAAEVKAAYRRRVTQAHPDRGGSAAEFIKVRAAYEILTEFLRRTASSGAGADAATGGAAAAPEAAAEQEEDEVPIPEDLRVVIDQIVQEFRQHQRWAEEETLAQLAAFEAHMSRYIQTASRAELRRFSEVFRVSWDAILTALFNKCNARSDEILQRYESWYTESTQAVFDDMYRKDLLSFARRRRFWEVFLIIGAIAGALTVVIGWGGSRRWVSIAVLLVAFAIAFSAHWWGARRRRGVRQKIEALSVVPFEIPKEAQFTAEAQLRQGRRTTAAFGLAGLFLGSAAAGGLAVPAAVAVAGAALGGALDRFVNPTGRIRESLQADLARFMAMARPQVVRYVLEAHQELLTDVRLKIAESYKERVKSTVKLLAAGK